MDKKDIKDFFDKYSVTWDKYAIKFDDKMNMILDSAEVKEGSHVLDIACGTGVMIDYYIERKVASVLGADISPNMIKIAEEKFSEYDNISFICDDAEEMKLEDKFDCCMVFNAFPHFPNPAGLINNLSRMVKDGGTLTVAHDRGRHQLEEHHSGIARKVSMGLISEDELAGIFEGAGLTVITKHATEDIYIVTGRK